MTDNPCHGCNERTMYCHSECDQYNNWLKIHIEEKRAEELESIRSNAIKTSIKRIKANKWKFDKGIKL